MDLEARRDKKLNMNDVILFFNQLSVVGLLFSFVVHLLGLMSRKPPFGYFPFILQLGAFVSGVAAALALFLLYASRGESFWKDAFRGCYANSNAPRARALRVSSLRSVHSWPAHSRDPIAAPSQHRTGPRPRHHAGSQ